MIRSVLREGIDEEIGALQIAQHADIEKIDRIRPGIDRFEVAVVDAVVDEFAAGPRLADLLLVGLALEIADEDDRVSQIFLEALDEEDDLSGQRGSAVVQAAAMRRIKAGNAIPVHPQG